MNTENLEKSLEHYNVRAELINDYVLQLHKERILREECSCNLKDVFLDMETAKWIFENCDEEILIQHQMSKVEQAERAILELNSDHDHQSIH